MSEDIVARLRARPYSKLEQEAADEIERLRAIEDAYTDVRQDDALADLVARAEAAESVVNQLERVAPLLETYDRAHSELDEGKDWSDIDTGYRPEVGRVSYNYWRAHMRQSLINGLRSAILALTEYDKLKGE